MTRLPGLLEMLSGLIATPSVSSTQASHDQSNLAVVTLLAEWFEALGFDAKVLPVRPEAGKYNLLARRGSGEGGLLLAGHTDTVPCDERLWATNPFALTQSGDRFHGLGTADMKGFFALVAEALKAVPAELQQRPLTLLATCDEESSMCGARALDLAQVSGARCALIGEPTSLRPVHCHKGIMMLNIRVRGQSGHSSDPARGRNAMEALVPILQQLMQFREQLAATHRDPGFEVAHPTLNLGCVHGGDNPNRICEQVDLQIDLRLLPGMANEPVKREIETLLLPLLAARGLEGSVEFLHPPLEPFRASGGTPLRQVLEELSGSAAGSVAFATEAPFLGALGLDTLILGPGNIEQAHRPNEFIDAAQFQPTIDIIQGLVRRCCLADPAST